MRHRRGESGEGRFGCLVGLILLAIASMVAYKMIPAKVKAAELRQVITDEARSAGTHNDKVIRGNILEKAKDLGLPLEDSGLLVARKDQYIKVEATYEIPIEFPGYTYVWHLHHLAENPIF